MGFQHQPLNIWDDHRSSASRPTNSHYGHRLLIRLSYPDFRDLSSSGATAACPPPPIMASEMILEVDIRLRIIYIESFTGEKSLAVAFTDSDHFDRLLRYKVNYHVDKVVTYIPSGR